MKRIPMILAGTAAAALLLGCARLGGIQHCTAGTCTDASHEHYVCTAENCTNPSHDHYVCTAETCTDPSHDHDVYLTQNSGSAAVVSSASSAVSQSHHSESHHSGGHHSCSHS